MATPIKVLIVEDEPIPAEYLKTLIEKDGDFVVSKIVDSADETIESIYDDREIKVITMDIMIRGSISGAELALKIHTIRPEILTIFTTAYSEKEMIEYAAEAEAFAYLLKPYRPEEIAATLQLAKARLRHPSLSHTNSRIPLSQGYSCDRNAVVLYHHGEPVSLGSKESKLIELLCQDGLSPVSAAALQENLGINSVSLRALIYRLRKRTHKDIIKSIKGVGYRLGTV